jgi:hypothetical protein
MLTADLVLQKYNSKGKLLGYRRQPSKSFVQQLFGLLYVCHASLPDGAPYDMTDILNQTRDVDGEYYGVPLRIAAPGGLTDIQWRLYQTDTVHIAGNWVGIQVGEGTTSTAPQDYALEGRIPHSSHVAETVDTKGEAYTDLNTPDNQYAYGTYWKNMRFTCMWPHQLRKVRLKLYREGSPGTVTVSVRDTETDADLVVATTNGDTLTTDTGGEWRDFDFPSPYCDLAFLEDYYITIRATGGDSSNRVWIVADDAGTYDGGYMRYSTSSGASWSSISGSPDALFEEYGRNLENGLEYGGCECLTPIISAPDAEFTIRRFFTNASGISWTINEVGIYAVGNHYPGECWTFCIARDLVSPGISLANTELLKVSYVPKITV